PPDIAHRPWDAGPDPCGSAMDCPDARHDAHRGKPGTLDAAHRAIDLLRDRAPRGPGQVFVMTVVMHDNVDDLGALLELSREHGVRHQVTVISTVGDGRHTRAQHRPAVGVGARLVELKRKFPHLASFTGYLEGIDEFL